ncbi:hypothetical protein HRG_011700 [Hirsutella rhossiliensis]|uniref:Uncharacterized protein n=1 Tax=Hirsutella rhossiliensis TaxID=111463 RepID=A0A9P8SC41_9HYPO|nr:uncharacterized protein HRG_11700 [Hirsutella rhossiliensis]KAH0957151.1 hypothetical protein HRG_11700 [Hirsutella rhossiliensis]
MKLWNKNKNYTGEPYDLFDYCIRIFMSLCYNIQLKPNQFHALLPHILADRAQMYYIDHISWTATFRQAYDSIKQHFDTEVNHAHYYTDWTRPTFTKLRMDNANATKSLQEVLQLLFDKLQRCQRALGREFADEVHLRTTLINACRGVPELQHALFKPSNKIEALFADLRSSIETHLARGTNPQYAQDDNQQYYLDRRYNNNRERGSGYRGSRDFKGQSYNRGRFNQRPQGNNNRPWTRKCFVCNKEGCWSTKHTAEERQKAKSQYVAHCHFTGTPVELAAYVTDYEGIEGDPLTMTATGMRIRMTMLTRNSGKQVKCSASKRSTI